MKTKEYIRSLCRKEIDDACKAGYDAGSKAKYDNLNLGYENEIRYLKKVAELYRSELYALRRKIKDGGSIG